MGFGECSACIYIAACQQGVLVNDAVERMPLARALEVKKVWTNDRAEEVDLSRKEPERTG